MTSSQTQWAAHLTTLTVPPGAEEAYHLYVEAHEQEVRSEFDEGGHDYTDFAAYRPPRPRLTHTLGAR